MLLKIANENKDSYEFRTIGDIAGVQHTFHWNAEAGAYCYAPKSARECDDICAVNWQFLNFPWKILPVFGAADVPAMVVQHGAGGAASPNRVPVTVASAKIPPYIKPEIYAQGYTVEELVLLARDCGFEPQGEHEAENIKRQIASYCIGRAWANEEVRRLKLEVANAAIAAAKAPAATGLRARRGPKAETAPATP